MKVSKPILIALALTIVVCGYVFLFTGKKKVVTGSAPIVTPVGVASVIAQVKEKSEKARPPIQKLDVSWNRDPFELPKAFETDRIETSRTPVKLVAILTGKHGRVAVIGNEVVKKGDMIGGEKVVEINQYSVVLLQGNSRRSIGLAPETREKAVKNTNEEVGK
jgi:hypothetical protein